IVVSIVTAWRSLISNLATRLSEVARSRKSRMPPSSTVSDGVIDTISTLGAPMEPPSSPKRFPPSHPVRDRRPRTRAAIGPPARDTTFRRNGITLLCLIGILPVSLCLTVIQDVRRDHDQQVLSRFLLRGAPEECADHGEVHEDRDTDANSFLFDDGHPA